MMAKLAGIFSLFLLFASVCVADETPFSHESFDGFSIDAMLSKPDGRPDSGITEVVILIGGSGPYDMNLDLSSITEGGKENLWLRDVSDGLVKKGFATIRYNKRPYQFRLLGKKIQEEKRTPTGEELALGKNFTKSPLKHYVDDARSFAGYARKRFPGARVYLLGGSEGTHVALWAAHEESWISGVVLVGFYLKPLDTIMFEQNVYRDLSYFRDLDKDRNEILSKEELDQGGQVGMALRMQGGPYDRDKDGALTLAEYKSMAAANNVRLDDAMDGYRLDEARYPSMSKVLRSSKIPVLFFQGMWDNQTPAFNTMAVEALAKGKWKKENLKFWYYPKLGHCLDPRDSYIDKVYRKISPEALENMAAGMAENFQDSVGEPGATSGKEWLEKFSAAAKNRDVETVWGMLSRKLQKKMVEMAGMIKGMVKDRSALKETFGVDADPKSISDEALARKMLFGKDGVAEITEWSFVSEKNREEKVIVTIEKGKKKDTMELIREDGSLKLVPN